MMPIIRPIPSQSVVPTEYKNEQALFAELQAASRRGQPLSRRLWTGFLGALPRVGHPSISPGIAQSQRGGPQRRAVCGASCCDLQFARA